MALVLGRVLRSVVKSVRSQAESWSGGADADAGAETDAYDRGEGEGGEDGDG